MKSRESWDPPRRFFDAFYVKHPKGGEAAWDGGGILKANQLDPYAPPRPEGWFDPGGPAPELTPYQPPDGIPTPEQQRPAPAPRVDASDARVWVCGNAVLDFWIEYWMKHHARWVTRRELGDEYGFSDRALRKIRDRGDSPLDRVDFARRKNPGQSGSHWLFDPSRLEELRELLETLPAPSPKPRTGRAPRSKTP